jgi:hypothetical protein
MCKFLEDIGKGVGIWEVVYREGWRMGVEMLHILHITHYTQRWRSLQILPVFFISHHRL